MASTFSFEACAHIGRVVNLLEPLSDPGRAAGYSGVAASAHVAVLGISVAEAPGLRARDEFFECPPVPGTLEIVVGPTLTGSTLGIPIQSSSLAEGLVVFAREGDTLLGVARVATGSLEVHADSKHLTGPLTAALTQLAPMETQATIQAMAQRVRITPLIDSSVSYESGSYTVILDGVYPILNEDLVIFDIDGEFFPFVVEFSDVEIKDISASLSIPLTVITIPHSGVEQLNDARRRLKIWFSPAPAGELIRLPASDATAAQILANTELDLATIVPLAIVDAEGTAVLVTSSDEIPDESLALPATVYTNLAVVTRGETIKNEILGSGNAAIPFQSFRLKKSPLTYLADPTAPNGRRSTLEVYVDGQKWREAQTFYGTLPTDQIYVVRHTEDHQTDIVFGDGELGQRVPTGVNNVVATYRFGVGGNVPANSINTLKRPIKGVRKVFNPLPASGGKEPPTPEQMRREAPLGMLVLGRLVSIPDFEAETRRFGNVVNAKARRGSIGSVEVWFATRDEGNPSNELRDYLEGLAEPNTQVTVTKATAVSKRLTIDLDVDPRYKAEDVELEVARRLFDDWDGVLSVRNMPIGGRLHRSKIYAVIHSVPGVLGIGGISIDAASMGASWAFEEGSYLDFENIDLVVGGTEAGKRLFGGT